VEKLSIQNFELKKKHLGFWATLENKSDQELTASYGAFKILVDGATYPGALRVPFVRVTKDFSVAPKMLKQLPGPVEALNVTPGAEGTLQLDNIVIQGKTDAPVSVSVNFPIMK
jgi:hypothetical protein